MIKVTEIRRTCIACPSQWSGRTDTGGYVYIRSRWDILTVSTGPTQDDSVYGDKCVIIAEIVDHAFGWLSYEELRALTKNVLDLPETDGAEEWPKREAE